MNCLLYESMKKVNAGCSAGLYFTLFSFGPLKTLYLFLGRKKAHLKLMISQETLRCLFILTNEIWWNAFCHSPPVTLIVGAVRSELNLELWIGSPLSRTFLRRISACMNLHLNTVYSFPKWYISLQFRILNIS